MAGNDCKTMIWPITFIFLCMVCGTLGDSLSFVLTVYVYAFMYFWFKREGPDVMAHHPSFMISAFLIIVVLCLEYYDLVFEFEKMMNDLIDFQMKICITVFGKL